MGLTLTRSMILKRPSVSISPTSPVCVHPSESIVFFVFSGSARKIRIGFYGAGGVIEIRTFVVSNEGHVTTDTNLTTRMRLVLARVAHLGDIDKLDLAVDVGSTDTSTSSRVLGPASGDASAVLGHTVTKIPSM